MVTFSQQAKAPQPATAAKTTKSRQSNPTDQPRSQARFKGAAAVQSRAVRSILRSSFAAVNRLETQAAYAGVQSKALVNTPGDKYERQADQIADQVVRMPGPQGSHSVAVTAETSNLLGKAGGAEGRAARDARGTPGALSSIVADALRSPGAPMDQASRGFMEARFDRDFSQVRVHTDAGAGALAGALGARAFTLGQHLVFGAGEYAPRQPAGRRLLAHELTHVVQQTATPAEVPALVQRDGPTDKQKEWLPELDEILPKGVGLLTHIDRVQTLVDIFGTKALEEHVSGIHRDKAATALTIRHGVPGIVALYDTRTKTGLDIPAAKKALSASEAEFKKSKKSRYARASLKQLRLVPEIQALLTPKERAERIRKQKQLEAVRAAKIAQLKTSLKADYQLADVVDGSEQWTPEHLQQVSDGFKFIPVADRKTLKGVVLKRVASLGGKTAGRFGTEQSVTGTSVTNNATLELANLAFKNSPSENHRVIVHEVGHALASMQARAATQAEHEATAERNRLVDEFNTAAEASDAAVEARNQTVDPLNAAARKLAAARKTGDKAKIATAKQAYLAAKQAYDTKLAEERRLKAITRKAEKKVGQAKKVERKTERAARKTRISTSALRAIKKKAGADKKRHDASLVAANKKTSSLSTTEKTESSAYVTAAGEVSSALTDFTQETADQALSADQVDVLVAGVQAKIDGRNSARKSLSSAHKDNPAIAMFARLEQAQDLWFESAKAHSLAHERLARVQKFVKFVVRNKIAPITPYAEENWPHKPEEFYAEAYSMFQVKPQDLKNQSKKLHDWFNAKKHL